MMLRTFHGLFFKLAGLHIPALAKISGQCLGGGMELATMCHFLFADKTTRFGQPEIMLGVFPPPASVILPEKIGLRRAEELLLTGSGIDALQAKQWGLINEVYEDKDELNSATEAWIQKNILPKSASSLRYSVRASRAKFNHIMQNFIAQMESFYLRELMQTHDANEGIAAFLEKRQPQWTNN
jgi:cyclohexa-1,5-dienecarbonyl-CoA hydratase